jgi:hypothetical protein
VTYRSDGGAKCAVCARGFSPDDLQLDVSGAWMCAECTRRKGDADATEALRKGLRARRRMQLFGVSLVVLAAVVIGGRSMKKRSEDRRLALLTTETHARVEKRLDALRAAVRTWQIEGERTCKVFEKPAFVPYLEATRLDGGTAWYVASSDFERMLFFERTPLVDHVDGAAAALRTQDTTGLIVVLLAKRAEYEVSAKTAYWNGHVVIADAASLAPLCWASLDVQAVSYTIVRSLDERARSTVSDMTNHIVQLRD